MNHCRTILAAALLLMAGGAFCAEPMQVVRADFSKVEFESSPNCFAAAAPPAGADNQAWGSLLAAGITHILFEMDVQQLDKLVEDAGKPDLKQEDFQRLFPRFDALQKAFLFDFTCSLEVSLTYQKDQDTTDDRRHGMLALLRNICTVLKELDAQYGVRFQTLYIEPVPAAFEAMIHSAYQPPYTFGICPYGPDPNLLGCMTEEGGYNHGAAAANLIRSIVSDRCVHFFYPLEGDIETGLAPMVIDSDVITEAANIYRIASVFLALGFEDFKVVQTANTAAQAKPRRLDVFGAISPLGDNAVILANPYPEAVRARILFEGLEQEGRFRVRFFYAARGYDSGRAIVDQALDWEREVLPVGAGVPGYGCAVVVVNPIGGQQ